MRFQVVIELEPYDEDGSIDKHYALKIWRLRKEKNMDAIDNFIASILKGEQHERSK